MSTSSTSTTTTTSTSQARVAIISIDDDTRNQITELIDRAEIVYEALADNPYNDSSSQMIINEILDELTRKFPNAPKDVLMAMLNGMKKLQRIKAGINIVEQTARESNSNNNKIRESAIPRFDGNALNYPRFKKQFYEIVINTTTSNAIKYEYLKTAVKESKRTTDIVCNAQDDESIEQIFERLDREYDNPIMIFDEIRNQINKCPRFTSSTDFRGWDAMHNVLAKANQRIRDPVQVESLKLQIMAKLPNDVLPSLRANNEPNLDFIFKYVQEMREFTLKLKPPQNLEQPPNRRQQQYRQPTITTNQCPLCKQTNHKIDKCPKLSTTNLNNLISKLKAANICIKCGMHRFRPDQQCQPTCSKCSGNHATYLCKNNNQPTTANVNSIEMAEEPIINEMPQDF